MTEVGVCIESDAKTGSTLNPRKQKQDPPKTKDNKNRIHLKPKTTRGATVTGWVPVVSFCCKGLY